MSICFYGEENENFEKIVKHWNSKTALKKGIGSIGERGYQELKAEQYLNDMSEHLFKIPFNSDFEFTKGMMNRLTREINKLDTTYKEGSLGVMQKYFYVGESLANYSPVTRVFYSKVNESINFERNRLDYYLQHSKEISDHIRSALVTESGLPKRKIKSMQKEFAELEKKILGGASQSEQADFLKRYDELFTFNGENVLNQYVELMSMPKGEYVKKQFGYNKDIREATKKSRKVLDKMGGVLVNGLDRMENVVKLLSDSPVHDKSTLNFSKRINEAKKRIRKGIESGDYLPHVLLENVAELNYGMRNVMEANTSKNYKVKAEQLVDRIEGMVPGVAQARNDILNNVWSKNPFLILDRYSKDVIAFNKINFIQEAFIPAMRRFQVEDINPEFVRSMRTYLEDTFQVATKGMGERPDWVNNIVRTTMAIETLKSMGLSFTGAIRNGASALWYFGSQGMRTSMDAVRKYNSTYSKELANIEREQGFTFTEGGKELIAEGLVPSSVKETDIKYNPMTGKVEYVDKGIKKTLDPLLDKAVSFSLVFHRFTENSTRKWMFRVAYVQAKERLLGHKVLVPKENTFDTETTAAEYTKANEAAIIRKATNFATKAVNNFAFEYASHAKARAVGGIAPTKLDANGQPVMTAKNYMGALGEVSLQFMHYPMSFAALQARNMIGAKDALMSRQWNAYELRNSMRFYGITLLSYALSVGLNLDITNLFQNDTVTRLKDLADYMTMEPEEMEGRKRGLINDFTGPIVGDMLYAANVFQLYETPDEHWKKVLTGYIDYYEDGDAPEFLLEDRLKGKKEWYEKSNAWKKLSISLDRLLTKDLPAIWDRRGFDVVRHELGLYGRSWTKDYGKAVAETTEQFTGVKPWKTRKKSQSPRKELDALLLDLLNKENTAE
tara:strand:- start:6624 stop:9317 length:2694 start_codon:yes stop_codon:yes gene_type:complete